MIRSTTAMMMILATFATVATPATVRADDKFVQNALGAALIMNGIGSMIQATQPQVNVFTPPYNPYVPPPQMMHNPYVPPQGFYQPPVQQIQYYQQPAVQPVQYYQQPVQQPVQYYQQPAQQPVQYYQQPAQQPVQYYQQPVQQPVRTGAPNVLPVGYYQ